ncbi:uncharacterized protein LOC122243955 [Penaeus japonicus]|uniref:uncharacterized protein LOC122243955 n=1 Tax=Penaeus japonicus TaxID=27405 RepID=UPI001C7161E8|nr:uncharacterized protein LOC122243955 [Penaeus japonicus]
MKCSFSKSTDNNNLQAVLAKTRDRVSKWEESSLILHSHWWKKRQLLRNKILRWSHPLRNTGESPDVTGVSRSGRVRKKSSKLADFESPDEIDTRFKRKTDRPQKSPQKGSDVYDESDGEIDDDLLEVKDEPLEVDDWGDNDDGDEDIAEGDDNDDGDEGNDPLHVDDDSTDMPRETSNYSQAQSLYLSEKQGKKNIMLKDGQVVQRKKAQRKDKGKSRFTAYMLWAREIRPGIIQANPNMGKASVSKRRRPNFSSEELLTLVASVQQRQEYLDGPLAATLPHQTKLKAWEEVTALVNASSKTFRSCEEIRSKYIDFKSNTKKKISKRKKMLTATGEDQPTVPLLTAAEEAMAQLLDPAAAVHGISDSLKSEPDKALPSLTTAFVKKEPLESSTLRAVTREQSQPCPSTHRVTQTSSRPSSMDSRTAQQSIGPCMLEVQEGILDEVQGIRSALECQTAALQRINETLLGLTNALNETCRKTYIICMSALETTRECTLFLSSLIKRWIHPRHIRLAQSDGDPIIQIPLLWPQALSGTCSCAWNFLAQSSYIDTKFHSEGTSSIFTNGLMSAITTGKFAIVTDEKILCLQLLTGSTKVNSFNMDNLNDFSAVNKRLGELWALVPTTQKYNWKRRAKRLAAKGNQKGSMISTGKAAKQSQNTARSNLINKGGVKPQQVVRTSAKQSDVGPQTTGPSQKAHTTPKTSRSVVTSISDHSPPSAYKVTGSSPIDVAAHIKLLGESLNNIGQKLKEHEGQIAVSGSLSVLLDSMLCVLGPLTCLTAQVEEIRGAVPEPTLMNILDNIAYIMPGIV